MSNAIQVVVLGTGQMGAGVIRLLREKPGLALAGVFGRRKRPVPTDVGDAIGLAEPIGLHVSNDLAELLARTRPELAIQATCSRVPDAMDELRVLLRHGVNVISIAEEMAYPACRWPHLAAELDELALEHDVSVLGTGINPGFVLDLLIITLSGVCRHIDSIRAERINDLSPYGPTVLRGQGVGMSREDFTRGIADGTVVGHIGFPESIAMIAHAVGWHIDRVEETREPIVSKVRRQTPFVTVEPGEVAGCRHTAVAYRGDEAVISLIHPQQVLPHLEGVTTGDHLHIKGDPDLRFSGSPEIPGGIATAALAVNMIPHVLKARAGLKIMTELPAPAALLGDVRHVIADRSWTGA